MAAGGYHHHLGFNTWRGEGVPAVPEGVVGLERWTVRLDGDALARLRARLEQAGIGVEAEAGAAILVRDPWDIAVEFTPG